MTCERHDVDGRTWTLCARSRRAKPRACACGVGAQYLCDHTGPSGRRCSAPCCPRCALVVGPDQHWCATHAAARPARQLALFSSANGG